MPAPITTPRPPCASEPYSPTISPPLAPLSVTVMSVTLAGTMKVCDAPVLTNDWEVWNRVGWGVGLMLGTLLGAGVGATVGMEGIIVGANVGLVEGPTHHSMMAKPSPALTPLSYAITVDLDKLDPPPPPPP